MAPISYADVMASNIIAARSRARLDQADVAARMQELGFGNWYAQTVGKTEKGDRRLLAHELAGLAFALETSVARLMAPLDEDHSVRLQDNGPPIPAWPLQMSAVGKVVHGAVRWDGNKLAPLVQDYPPVDPQELAGIADLARRHHDERKAREAPSIVAAIVTSPLGVLVGRRNDGKPPWTFIAGEQDAVKDENPADTAVREVKEETGLRVQVGDVIGERVHPKTGRRMIYIAAVPTHGTDYIVGDEEELAEVRWVGLAEADELLPGMFEPVREHLVRELGKG